MIRFKVSVPLVLTCVAVAATAEASTPIRRFALVAGANRGAAGRVPLRYAVTDAERFGDLVSRMGGVQPADRTVLKDPTRREFIDALAAIGQKSAAARNESERVEVVVYFSGHADEQGLMLGKETVPYRELRSSIGAMGADVGIAILDACASGAITRLKGGKTHPGFLADSPSGAKGYAYLTSSSETEAAQESDRLRGSFFTGALLTGLRGAADTSGDGRVTLNEAYQFAFNETIAQTTTTEAGAQHPAYDIKMAGTGDVVMTDVRKISSRLVLGESYDGRFLVLSSRRALVAELYKPQGRAVELGLEPGKYDVYFEQDKKLSSAEVTLTDGQRTELLPAALKPAQRRPGQRRGIDDIATGAPDLLHGRTRFEVARLGNDLAIRGAHWLTPTLGLTLSAERVRTETFLNSGFVDGYERSIDLMGGVRFYPYTQIRVRPYAGLEVGWRQDRSVSFHYSLDASGNPFLTGGSSSFSGYSGVGFRAQLGVDLYLGRSISLNVSAASGSVDRSRLASSIGWTFGKGRPR